MRVILGGALHKRVNLNGESNERCAGATSRTSASPRVEAGEAVGGMSSPGFPLQWSPVQLHARLTWLGRVIPPACQA